MTRQFVKYRPFITEGQLTTNNTAIVYYNAYDNTGTQAKLI